MMDYSLKNKIDSTFRMVDDLQNYNSLLTRSTGMTVREMLKYNLIQFCGFLFESDGTDGRGRTGFYKRLSGNIYEHFPVPEHLSMENVWMRTL